MNKEGFNDLIGKIRTSIGEEASALNSEDFLGTIAAYNEVYDKLDEANSTITKLKATNEELLKTNGRLFQKIGFNDPEPSSIGERIPVEKKISIDEIIDEKGGFR